MFVLSEIQHIGQGDQYSLKRFYVVNSLLWNKN